MVVWSYRLVKLMAVKVPDESSVGARTGIVDLGVLKKPLLEDRLRLVPLTGRQQIHDAPASSQIDDRAVRQRVVELPQLKEDSIDAPDVGKIGLGLPKKVDRMVVPPTRAKRPSESFVLIRLAQTRASTASASPA
jgi:hypothetical protein